VYSIKDWPPVANPPEEWRKPNPSRTHELVRRVRGFFHKRNEVLRPWVEDFTVRHRGVAEEESLPEVEWADWDASGRLVMVRNGQLLTRGVTRAAKEEVLADFNAMRPEELAPTPEALHW
jgi:hypothetical protein